MGDLAVQELEQGLSCYRPANHVTANLPVPRLSRYTNPPSPLQNKMADIFDSLLSLEEDFYQEGYALGVKDGEQAGRIEGRAFGLEKGFEKFLELGRLQGRCSVWKARIPPQSTAPPATVDFTGKPSDIHITNSRVQKQAESLAVILTNPPFMNDEESVEEVDETLKRGRNKAKVLSNMLGEKDENGSMKVIVDDESIEDAGRGARGAGKI